MVQANCVSDFPAQLPQSDAVSPSQAAVTLDPAPTGTQTSPRFVHTSSGLGHVKVVVGMTFSPV